MAIDSTLFAAQVPAATYAVGDRIPLAAIRGPSVVRDGYGAAKLKRIFTFGNTTSTWVIKIKNSNWVDELSNPATDGSAITVLSETSGNIQKGHDCDLFPNSGWQVYAECIIAGTEAVAADLLAMIDIDYPKVAAIYDPRNEKGAPVTIDMQIPHTMTPKGSAATAAAWTTFNVDMLKAGYRYLLTESAFKDSTATSGIGFVSISGAAAQGGLERIIPCRAGAIAGLRYLLDYSTPLTKGPMNINLMSIGGSGSTTAYLYFDFVKRNVST